MTLCTKARSTRSTSKHVCSADRQFIIFHWFLIHRLFFGWKNAAFFRGSSWGTVPPWEGRWLASHTSSWIWPKRENGLRRGGDVRPDGWCLSIFLLTWFLDVSEKFQWTNLVSLFSYWCVKTQGMDGLLGVAGIIIFMIQWSIPSFRTKHRMWARGALVFPICCSEPEPRHGHDVTRWGTLWAAIPIWSTSKGPAQGDLWSKSDPFKKY